MTEKKTQMYGWFSQKQLEIITSDSSKGCDQCRWCPMYYIENGNKIICTMVSRDPEEHGTSFEDIQLLGKVNEYNPNIKQYARKIYCTATELYIYLLRIF